MECERDAEHEAEIGVLLDRQVHAAVEPHLDDRALVDVVTDLELGVREHVAADAPRVEEERAAVCVCADGTRVVAEAEAGAEAELELVGDAERALEVEPRTEEV